MTELDRVVSGQVVTTYLRAATGSAPALPSVGDPRILIDLRAGASGKSNSGKNLQNVVNDTEFRALFWGTGQECFLSADLDGAGTQAAGIAWTEEPGGYPAGCSGIDQDNHSLSIQLTGGYAAVYVYFKMRLGRTTTGGGNGAVDFWQQWEPNCPIAHRGNKEWVFFRTPASPDYRLDWWSGSQVNRFIIGSKWGGASFGGLGFGWDQMQKIAQDLEMVYYMERGPAAPTAGGIVRFWEGGTLYFEDTNVNWFYDFDSSFNGLSDQLFSLLKIPSTFRNPSNMTKYYWDFVIWEP